MFSSTISPKGVKKNRKPDYPPVLQRIAKADMTAVEDCINTFGDLIWNLAKKHTPTAKEAENAVSDIFLDIWKHAKHFDPEMSGEIDFIILIAWRRLIKYPDNAVV
jgi:DNA-directed RNA polymerase specialized sigma24 family protein